MFYCKKYWKFDCLCGIVPNVVGTSFCDNSIRDDVLHWRQDPDMFGRVSWIGPWVWFSSRNWRSSSTPNIPLIETNIYQIIRYIEGSKVYSVINTMYAMILLEHVQNWNLSSSRHFLSGGLGFLHFLAIPHRWWKDFITCKARIFINN